MMRIHSYDIQLSPQHRAHDPHVALHRFAAIAAHRAERAAEGADRSAARTWAAAIWAVVTGRRIADQPAPSIS